MDGFLKLFFLLFKIFGLYFGLISVFTLLRGRRFPETRQLRRFAVLIPCRNEESCISGLIESLRGQDYPSALVDIYVLPNNCSDNTAGAARRAGAKVLEMPRFVHSKGEALHEAFAQLLPLRRYDAYCVFDADNEADPGFLAAVNRTLDSGARAVKSRILSKNRYQSWVCACYDIYFCTANRFLNRPRDTLGLSARIIGTGFAVSAELMEELGGFQSGTLAEDAEFYASLCAAGERIAFCPQAVTYDEEPLSFRTSLIQRRRWMSGIMQVTTVKAGPLLKGLLHRKSCLRCMDALLQFVFSYLQALLPLILALKLAQALPSEGLLISLALSLVGGWVSCICGAVLALLLERRLTWRMWKGILLYPLFFYSFIPLQTLALFKRTTRWQPIPHTGVRRAQEDAA